MWEYVIVGIKGRTHILKSDFCLVWGELVIKDNERKSKKPSFEKKCSTLTTMLSTKFLEKNIHETKLKKGKKVFKKNKQREF